MIYTLMNKNKPVIDFEMQMGTILRITDALRNTERVFQIVKTAKEYQKRK